MRYVSIDRPGEAVIKECPIPNPRKGEALLKMLFGGLCGSDLNTYRGTMAYSSYPRVPGHEFSAEIVEIGENSMGLRPGMIVTGNPYFNCGHCYPCRKGLVNCCETNQTMGVQRDGAFAEYFTMPVERLYNGKGIPPEQLALIEPFCVGYHGIKRAGIHKDDKVLILGAGTIGVFAAMSARLMGGQVYICDIAPEKLQYAESHFNITGTVSNDYPVHFMDQVKAITHADGFDVVIEAVGLASTFQNCIDACAYGGKMVQIGIGKQNADFSFTSIQKKELNIAGSRNSVKEDFLHLIDFVSEGRISIKKVITHTYDFLQAGKAFSNFDTDTGSILKVMLKF
nr:zinc-binding alcohol dehydrogenase family protein [uncultured Caproiciproducens sp.]